MRYQLTFVRMAIILKHSKTGNKYWRGYGETETLLYCSTNAKWYSPEKQLDILKKF